jgi:fructosamine-3-kinase
VSPLPHKLIDALRERLGGDILATARLSGGMVPRVARVDTRTGRFVVKWAEHAPPWFFVAEAYGLRLLRDTGLVRIPELHSLRNWHPTVGEQVRRFREVAPTLDPLPHSRAIMWLILEYVPPSPPADARRLAEGLGLSLARMHRECTPDNSSFGLDDDNYIGALPQINEPHRSWPDFYRDRRILPQMEIARKRGLLSAHRESLLNRLMERLDDLLGGDWARPCLIHGDLWSGNLLTAGDEPVLIDPAVYYGDREMEIGYMQLFSGFHPATFQAYEAAYPLDPGYADRRPLHQLYPLLVHLNHFGEQYGPDIDGVCQHYLR